MVKEKLTGVTSLGPRTGSSTGYGRLGRPGSGPIDDCLCDETG